MKARASPTAPKTTALWMRNSENLPKQPTSITLPASVRTHVALATNFLQHSLGNVLFRDGTLAQSSAPFTPQQVNYMRKTKLVDAKSKLLTHLRLDRLPCKLIVLVVWQCCVESLVHIVFYVIALDEHKSIKNDFKQNKGEQTQRELQVKMRFRCRTIEYAAARLDSHWIFCICSPWWRNSIRRMRLRIWRHRGPSTKSGPKTMCRPWNSEMDCTSTVWCRPKPL